MSTGLLVWDCTWAEALRLFRASGAQLLGPDHVILSPDVLAEAERGRIPLVPWTINEATRLSTLLDASAIVGVITDRPDLAIAARRR
jgi:glycerophosphoryl diester phosphodiesterase